MYYIIVITSIIIYFIEGRHDYNLQKLYSNKNEFKYVENWHKYDFIFHILSVLLLSYISYGVTFKALILLINIGFLRQLILNSTLNILNGKHLWYLGNTSKIDKILKPYEIYVFIFLLIINISLIIFGNYER
jgi:hypothetical protein